MLQQIRLVFAALLASTVVVGCAVSADPEGSEAGPVTEVVGSAQQALASSGYYRTYYSDATYTTWVGSLTWDCDPQYRESEGETSAFYKQTRFNCPGYNDPFLPNTTCNLCTTYTTSTGYTFQNCAPIACPLP